MGATGVARQFSGLANAHGEGKTNKKQPCSAVTK